MKKIVSKLKKFQKTLSVMESCTGGMILNEITNIEGASEILKFGAVTYSNEFKIKMGVDINIIDEYSVYSIQTAMEMSKKISEFTNSDYGIGITGKLNKIDKNNLAGNDNEVFISIYNKGDNNFYNYNLIVSKNTRSENKREVANFIIEKLNKIIK